MAPSKPPIPPKIGTLVAYNHVTGEPYLVDTETGKVAPIPMNLPDGKDMLKDENGNYRKEVKNECLRLFMAGVPKRDIHERTGVSISALDNWIYCHHSPGRYETHSWIAARKRMLAESKQLNMELHEAVAYKMLKKVEEFFASAKSNINNAQDFAVLAEAINKMSKAVSEPTPKGPRVEKATQVNVFNAVTPLSPAESRQLIENDPIRRIAQAKTKQAANAVLEDAEIIDAEKAERAFREGR